MLLAMRYSSPAMPAISRHLFIVLPSSDAVPALGSPGLSGLLGRTALEQPRLSLLERGDVAAAVVKQGARRLHAAAPRHLYLEPDALALAARLELRDPRVPLGERAFVLGSASAYRPRRRLLPRPRLRVFARPSPDVFRRAIYITSNQGHRSIQGREMKSAP